DGGGEDRGGRRAVEADAEGVVEGVLLDRAGTAGDVEGALAEVDLETLAHVLRVVRPRQESGEAGADAVDVDDPLRLVPEAEVVGRVDLDELAGHRGTAARVPDDERDRQDGGERTGRGG